MFQSIFQIFCVACVVVCCIVLKCITVGALQRVPVVGGFRLREQYLLGSLLLVCLLAACRTCHCLPTPASAQALDLAEVRVVCCCLL